MLFEMSYPRAEAGFRLLVAISAVIYVAAVALLAAFVADDAYIVVRYVENLVDFGALEFNLGEPVMAFTSPLHAGLAAALYALTGATLASYKVVSAVLVGAAVALLLREFAGCLFGRSIVLVVVLLSPCVTLWTFGGLETPLLLFLVTALVVGAYAPGPFGGRRLSALVLLAGLCFLTRYDSTLFAAPMAVFAAVRGRRPARIGLALAIGALLPIAWLVGSWLYYGSVIPTSFYVKMPGAQEVELVRNFSYLVGYFSITGLVPLLLLLWAESRPRSLFLDVVAARARRHWGLYLGLAAIVVYGLWVATTHMLFSFRYFVPYLPAAALLLADLYRESAARAPAATTAAHRRSVRFVCVALILALFQGYQLFHTYAYSLNGIVGIGEYPRTGVRGYLDGMLSARAAIADDIRGHWEGLHRQRAPRIFTTAGGLLPYRYREAYVLERLVSYRRHCTLQRSSLGRFADYVHFVSPRHGKVSGRLAKPVGRYELVSQRYVVYDGVLESFLVYYDPHPAENPLPPRVNDACESRP